jgi:hypothetical protein
LVLGIALDQRQRTLSPPPQHHDATLPAPALSR